MLYRLRVPASCVLYVLEAQGSLPRGGAFHCMYALHIPTVASQVLNGYTWWRGHYKCILEAHLEAE